MRYTVFDIETRIDKALVRAVFFPQDEDAYQQKRQQLLERQGNDFFPLAFHVPVSIAIGQVDEARVLTAVETLTPDVANEASSEAGPPDAASTCPCWNSRPSSTGAASRVISAAGRATATRTRATTTCTTS